MAYEHEFGIIDKIEKGKVYGYEPKKYGCIAVDGEFIDEIYHQGFGERMQQLKTFVNDCHTPYQDLGYYGVTLIPPSSLSLFLEIIEEAYHKWNNPQLVLLMEKISEAIREDKWMIHFGV